MTRIRPVGRGLGFLDGRYAFTIFDAIVAPSGGDYTDIESAINGGATSIFVRDGTYTLTADINVDVDGITIVGETKSGVIINCGTNSILVTADNCSISNLELRTGTDAVNGVISLGVTSSEIIYCVIDNVIFNNNDRNIVINAASASKITNCNFIVCGGVASEAYVLIPSGNGNYLFNSEIVNNYFTAGPAIRFVGGTTESNKVLIANNVIEGLPPNNENLIFIQNSDRVSISNNLMVISGLTVASLTSAITVDTNCTQIIINNNNINNSGNNLIFEDAIRLNSGSCIISGNIIIGGNYGITINDVNQNMISGNFIDSVNNDGIIVGWTTGNADNNVIANNIIVNCGQWGIDIWDATAQSNIITANILLNNTSGAFTNSGTNTQLGLNVTS